MMLCRFFRESALACAFLGPAHRLHPIIDHPYAKAVTPDQLIAGYCIQNIAKHFDDWAYTRKMYGNAGYTYNCVLEHREKKITIKWKENAYDAVHFAQFNVNNQPIDHDVGVEIAEAYLKIKRERDRLEHIAAEAKRKMEEDQKKWDFAEKLLGMKRLPSGALVPKDYEEPENKFDPCPFSCCQKAPNQANCEGK